MAQNKPIKRSGEGKSLNNVKQTETVHHESARKKRGKGPHRVGELNLTSMLDVCFQLLIFFILTASFTKGEGLLPAHLPEGQGQTADVEEAPEQPITILLRFRGLDAEGEQLAAIEVQGVGSVSDAEELYQRIRSMQNNAANPTGVYNPDDPVIIKPDGNVGWGHVVNAFNAATRARYTNVNFAQPGK